MPQAYAALKPRSLLQLFLLFSGVILLCCLLGIATRHLTFLASFWPANSVLLGLLIRFPQTRHPISFIGAIVGYLVADTSQDTPFLLNICLTSANLLYVITTLTLYIKFNAFIRSMHHGYFYLFLFSFCCIGGLASSFFAAITLPLFNTKFALGSFWIDFGYWFTAEIQNALLLLPAIISAPLWSEFKQQLKEFKTQTVQQSLPLFAVIFSIAIGYYDAGPGSLLYPIAALIWCALSYRHFSVAIITSISCAFVIYHVSQNYLLLYPEQFLNNAISIRLGLIMMTIAPLTVSSINMVRSKLIQELQHTIAHDELTSSLTRRQFLQSVQLLQQQATYSGHTTAFLMLDIDHFKQVNDNYGHQMGDRALQSCVQTIQTLLKPQDLLGRLGGEEFAIFMTDTDADAAYLCAEKIRLQISQTPIEYEIQQSFSIQMSIGICICIPENQHSIEQLFKQADDALYLAKRQGRNQVVIST
ncbi:diguanylate cyclase [Acinetobacter sp. C26M]|uniref:GGDEF domain-containing protein n=1 Tax=unclassified Acinetobacter TaxID=196816 RepID=UPI001421E296|nr:MULTISPECIES: sensor domain-containing diguanylate cyclase [unclassified Acinetobacter]NIE95739.1 diguanylate cyclase [Acinetobacter sp. Tr-809]USA47238.1 diguanylate cyclase [Acinetobacter sp. C26M]USA50719.1 diguanylate cyclase [Acinetobacter sp. C26G]